MSLLRGGDHARRLALGLAVLLAMTPGCAQLLGAGLRTQWAYDDTEIQSLMEEDLTGEEVRVAVVDTGIDPSHPDMEGVKIRAWRDFVNGRSTPYDDNGHGTHVSGIVAAQGRDSDLRGGAPDVSLIVAKAIDDDGSGQSEDVANAISWASRQNVDVLSLSLGGGRLPVLGSQTEDAAQSAVQKGIYVVAAVGNDGEDDDGQVATPANVPGVIAVGAVNEQHNVAPFSSRGSQSRDQIGPISSGSRQDPNKKPEIVAPGVGITSTWRDGEYRKASGTSQAVPFVTSALALTLEDKPDWQRDGSQGGDRSAVTHVKRALMNSADPLSGQDTPHDDRAGYGLLKAARLRDRV